MSILGFDGEDLRQARENALINASQRQPHLTLMCIKQLKAEARYPCLEQDMLYQQVLCVRSLTIMKRRRFLCPK